MTANDETYNCAIKNNRASSPRGGKGRHRYSCPKSLEPAKGVAVEENEGDDVGV
jgi:hypothetical protein